MKRYVWYHSAEDYEKVSFFNVYQHKDGFVWYGSDFSDRKTAICTANKQMHFHPHLGNLIYRLKVTLK